jgi:hypothetical protein
MALALVNSSDLFLYTWLWWNRIRVAVLTSADPVIKA